MSGLTSLLSITHVNTLAAASTRRTFASKTLGLGRREFHCSSRESFICTKLHSSYFCCSFGFVGNSLCSFIFKSVNEALCSYNINICVSVGVIGTGVKIQQRLRFHHPSPSSPWGVLRIYCQGLARRERKSIKSDDGEVETEFDKGVICRSA